MSLEMEGSLPREGSSAKETVLNFNLMGLL